MKSNQSVKCRRRFSPIIISPPLSERILKKQKKKKRSGGQELKSRRQIKILLEYYSRKKFSWPTRDIRTLSLITGLPYQKVYKYLWNKRNRERRKLASSQKVKQNVSSSQNNPPEQTNPQPEIPQQITRMKQIQIKKVTMQLPEKIMFASEFYLLQSQQVPKQAIEMIIEGGFSLILDKA